MTTPITPGITLTAYLSSPLQEKQSLRPDDASMSAKAVSGSTALPISLKELINDLAGDKKNTKTFIDIVDDTCGKLVSDFDKKINALNEIQFQRQAAIADLFVIRSALENYRMTHLGQEGPIDLSGIEVRLPEHSPMRPDRAGNIYLVKLMAYYRQEHPELGLYNVPTTVTELQSYEDQIDTAVKMTLEPSSQSVYVELETLIQERRAMLEFQSMVYRIIFDAFKKSVSSM